MKLFLQIGHGMMAHCKALQGDWGDATAILSPRDLDASQLDHFSASFSKKRGELLFDPQFYLPRATHRGLTSQSFWPADYDSSAFWQDPSLESFVRDLAKLGKTYHASRLLLPGTLTEQASAVWRTRQTQIAKAASAQDIYRPEDVFATVAVSSACVVNDAFVADLISEIDDWDVGGIYLVMGHPDGQFLVSDPAWLGNALTLVSALALQGKKVIVGYCTQQGLLFSAAGASAIGSGTYMNVRSFLAEKFLAPDPDDEKRKSVWYYLPQALSEYQVTLFPVAERQNALNLLKPPPGVGTQEVTDMIENRQWAAMKESPLFRHYLCALRTQCEASRRATFDETVHLLRDWIDKAETRVEKLRDKGLRGKHHALNPSIADSMRSALLELEREAGPALRRNWDSVGQ